MKQPGSNPPPQAGTALIVALILLVVMTLLGLSGIRTVALEERMTANTYDRGLAFQAAEAALRAGEQVAETQSASANAGFPTGTPSAGHYVDADDTCVASPCTSGLCSTPDKDCPARWLDDSFAGWVNAGVSLGTLATAPQYFIEFLGDTFPCDVNNLAGGSNCKRYRVTARSRSSATSTQRSMVILQSIYATE